MQSVEVFPAYESPETLEKTIKDWIEDQDGKVEIAQVQFSTLYMPAGGGKDGRIMYSAMLLYEDKRPKDKGSIATGGGKDQ